MGSRTFPAWDLTGAKKVPVCSTMGIWDDSRIPVAGKVS